MFNLNYLFQLFPQLTNLCAINIAEGEYRLFNNVYFYKESFSHFIQATLVVDEKVDKPANHVCQ